MKSLEQAVEDLEFLTSSDVGFVLDEESSELPHTLVELLAQVEPYEAWANRKKNAPLDDAKAAIVRHVTTRAKDRHHTEVSVLIHAALKTTTVQRPIKSGRVISRCG